MEVSDADKDGRRAALIERLSVIADLCCENPLKGPRGDVAYELLRQAAAQIASDRQVLSTQAAELDALRGEVERLNAIYHSPTGDNHHNAARCPYCRPEYEQDHATIAQLRDRVAGLEHIASDLLQHIDWLTCGLPKMLEDAALTDEEGLIGAAVDAANSARALLTQNEVG